MGKGCKVVVCGQAAVGKTAILEQLLYGNHSVGEDWTYRGVMLLVSVTKLWTLFIWHSIRTFFQDMNCLVYLYYMVLIHHAVWEHSNASLPRSSFAVSVTLFIFRLYLSGSESNETQEDVYVASVETDRGVKEQLRLYDTKGLNDGQDLPKHYYSVADGFVLVYSVDSLESFKRVDVLKKEIDKSRDKKEVRLGWSLLGQTLHRLLAYHPRTSQVLFLWADV